MPASGGRLGWNEPPPAAMITIFAARTVSASVSTRKRLPSSAANGRDGRHHLVEVEGRGERRNLLLQIVDQLLAGDDGKAGNVVDRLLRIKLGALAADLRQNVDDMRLHVEQAEFEHGEQADRPGADDGDVGENRFGQCVTLACRGW